MEKSQDPEYLIKKAEEELSPGFFKAVFWSDEERYEKAIKCYSSAISLLLSRSKFERAGEVFFESAKVWRARGEKEEEYSSYLKSVECFGKAKNDEKEIKAIDKCVEICLSSCSFSSAASLTKKKAEIEKKIKKKKNQNEKNEKKKKEDAEEVVGLFSLAEDYFSMSKEASEEEKNALKEAKADCIVEFELKDDFDIAKFLYDEVGAFWAKKNAAKYRAPHYFAKVVLLQLAYDEYITSKSSLQKYLSKFSSLPFSSSPLWLLSEKLVGLFADKKCGNETGENFAGVVGEYKKKAEWDDWAEIVVGRIKEKLDEVEKEFENGGEEEDFK